jgi:hypothetical protein
LDSRGATPLLNLFSKLGGFPLLDGENWNENDWTPDKVLAGMPFLYFQIYWFLVKNDSVIPEYQNIWPISLIKFKFSTD